MGSETGLLLTCDRCGDQVFLRKTGQTVTDGGYTRRDDFEAAPEWKYYSDVRRITMCPRCSQQYKDLFERFMKEVEYEPLVRCPGAEGEELSAPAKV